MTTLHTYLRLFHEALYSVRVDNIIDYIPSIGHYNMYYA